MDAFLKALETAKGQRRALKAAARSRRMLRSMTDVMAVSFGAMCIGPPALQRNASTWPLVVALARRVNPDVPAMLRYILGHNTVIVELDRALLCRTIEQTYLKQTPLNLPTFESPDFLQDDDNAGPLMDQKYDVFPKIPMDLPAEDVVLVDVALHSVLRNLDGTEEVEMVNWPAELAFMTSADQPLWLSQRRLTKNVRLVVQRSFFYDGTEHALGVTADITDRPSVVIHPSEIQIVGVEADGTIQIYLYDKTVRVAPGQTGTYTFEYYYLRYGWRYHRTLTLDVRGVWRLRRKKLQRGKFAEHAGAEEFGRLLGAEFFK